MRKRTLWHSVKHEVIARISWHMLLWAIEMTDKQYFYEVYKRERDRMCIEHPPHD